MNSPAGPIARRFLRVTSPPFLRDVLRTSKKFHGANVHLSATLDWMLRAIRATGGQGVSAHYSIGVGWGSGYPETTGYIVPTFLKLSEHLQRPDLAETALRLSNWLLRTQKPSGGFPGGELKLDLEETVFNTGQIIGGLAVAWEKSRRPEFLESAVWGGEWLISVQSEDGAWRKFTSPLTTTKEHSYDVLSAWGLYRVGKASSRPEFCEAALRQYRWTLTRQVNSGFFIDANFEAGVAPLTHSLAYVAEGILELWLETGDEAGLVGLRKLMEALYLKYGDLAELPGRLDESLSPAAKWSCVTGNVQFGLVATRLGRKISDDRWVVWGKKLIENGAATQSLSGVPTEIQGGVFGSSPVYGGYFPFTVLNWAAKYLLDGLMEVA